MQLEGAHTTCKRARDANAGNVGVRPATMIGAAARAARASHRGEVLDDEAWRNRYAVLAGCLPSWADDERTQVSGAMTKEVSTAIVAGQALATRAAEAWREAAAPGMAWLRHRARERGLMTLVLRGWREQVEHDTPGINNDRTRWRVRRERRPRDGPRTRGGVARNARPSAPSDERKFADARLANFGQVAEDFTWSPWRDANPPRTSADGGDDLDHLRRWRLKCDMLRVATYYRVTGAHMHVCGRPRADCTAGCERDGGGRSQP